MKLKLTAMLSCLLMASAAIHAQPDAKTQVFPLGVTTTIRSGILSQPRVLNIYQPEGYHKDSTYPVVYLLDASANEDFIHVAGLVQFLNMIGHMPPSIIVGIANTDRKHDFTYPSNVKTSIDMIPNAGGSEKFIRFIAEELQPYIKSTYKVSRSLLIGQSLGGLLASEIVLKKPELFDDYIIISPSLWWDDESLLKQAPMLIKGNNYSGKRIYIAAGNEMKQMVAEAEKLTSLIQQSKSAGLKANYIYFPDEDHLTILHNSLYKIFTLLYKK